MKMLVLYYSRTGTTRKLATAIAKKLKARLGEITCPQYEGLGNFAYMSAGMFSLLGKLPEIEMPKEAATEYDLVLIGTPIWTSYPALPIRTLLRDHANICKKVALFTTGGDHSPPKAAFDMMENALAGETIARLACNSDEIAADELDPKLDAFIAEVNQAFSNPKQ